MIRISILNLFFFIVMLVINYYQRSSVGYIANEQIPLIQPANYAFSIWLLIYFLLFIWIVKGFFVRGKKGSVYRENQLLIPINFILNGAWILAFAQQRILMSTIIIFLLLISLIRIYNKIKRNANKALFDLIPFSIYLGWVSIASIVNVFTFFVRNNVITFLGIDELGWTVVMLLFASLLTVVFILINRDILYPTVIIWSYIAIYINNQEVAINKIIMSNIILISIFVLFISISKVKAEN
ncbi:tryptophan-rich sensory protein [Psychrobacillus sp. NPDC058041]|uniref:tryptophan-rich sensory protein n=1 Tax=Psychrobacillus sp. NPDC058041 TaxID=3346310 RepID=UPI0036DBDFA6